MKWGLAGSLGGGAQIPTGNKGCRGWGGTGRVGMFGKSLQGRELGTVLRTPLLVSKRVLLLVL